MAVFELLWSVPNEKQLLSIVLLFDLWSMWNKVDISEIERSAEEDCHVIQKHLLDFQSAVVQPNAANEVTREQVSRWPYKLAHDQVKINFDPDYIDNGSCGTVVLRR
jgi:hypothetical protein